MKNLQKLSGLLASVSLLTAVAPLAMATPQVNITENKITLVNPGEALIGVELDLKLTTGTFETAEFLGGEGFSFVVFGDQEATLYLTQESQSEDINFGTLVLEDEVEFDVSALRTVNFLQIEESFYDIPVVYVATLDENLEEDSENDLDSDEFQESSDSNFKPSIGTFDDVEVESEESVSPEETTSPYQSIIDTFQDVNGHWAMDNIGYVVDKGYFNGVSETEFAPNIPMSRAMFVTVMWSMCENKHYADLNPFTDVKLEDWFYPYVSWAIQNNVATGTTGTTFSPNNSVSREEMALMVYNYINSNNYTIEATLSADEFSDDEKINDWAKEAVYYMRDRGILSGKEGNQFDPQGQATRGEVATIIANLSKLIGLD